VNYNDLNVSDDVIAAVDAGHKIEAIKILREETGLGLAEAKDVVDRLARSRKGEPVEAARMPEEGGAGGLIKMVVLIAVILGVYFYFFAG
jgi:Ribosomal protein L7/L12 C-terminal domain